ncbi:hypothetical protein BHM03_00040421 [Ensete ventricosum]|nr:hypothetical protein BHM03_00040421 [Ensete ventricosum]
MGKLEFFTCAKGTSRTPRVDLTPRWVSRCGSRGRKSRIDSLVEVKTRGRHINVAVRGHCTRRREVYDVMDPLPTALANPPLIYAIRPSGLTIKVLLKHLSKQLIDGIMACGFSITQPSHTHLIL